MRIQNRTETVLRRESPSILRRLGGKSFVSFLSSSKLTFQHCPPSTAHRSPFSFQSLLRQDSSSIRFLKQGWEVVSVEFQSLLRQDSPPIVPPHWRSALRSPPWRISIPSSSGLTFQHRNSLPMFCGDALFQYLLRQDSPSSQQTGGVYVTANQIVSIPSSSGLIFDFCRDLKQRPNTASFNPFFVRTHLRLPTIRLIGRPIGLGFNPLFVRTHLRFFSLYAPKNGAGRCGFNPFFVRTHLRFEHPLTKADYQAMFQSLLRQDPSSIESCPAVTIMLKKVSIPSKRIVFSFNPFFVRTHLRFGKR